MYSPEYITTPQSRPGREPLAHRLKLKLGNLPEGLTVVVDAAGTAH